MRILIADAFPDSSRAALDQRGHECTYEPDTTTEQLPDAVPGFDALIVRGTKVAAGTFTSADALRLVVRAGSGTNTIDCAAATRHDVAVCNVPGRNAAAVAELAFGLLLAIDREIPDNVADLRRSRWNKSRYAHARGVHGRDVGVVGLGHIGMAFARRAAAFGTNVHAVAKAHRDSETLEHAREIGITFVDSLHTLAATCDVLSLHLPGTEHTGGLIDRELLDLMRPGSILLNTARGDVVDADALIEVMESKGIRAGLDVFVDEPGSGTGVFESRLAQHPNVYGTHHIGASTQQAQHAVADGVLEIIDRFVDGSMLHCVNPETSSADVAALPEEARS